MLLAALPDDVVVAPPVAFGSSDEHQAFAGTIAIGQAAIEEFLVELGRSAACTWRRILWISTHGGNGGPVGRAARRLRDEDILALIDRSYGLVADGFAIGTANQSHK